MGLSSGVKNNLIVRPTLPKEISCVSLLNNRDLEKIPAVQFVKLSNFLRVKTELII
jgi:hypothetical protein